MRRVEDVLGKDWDMHPEGKKLKELGDAFAKKLNTEKIVEKWVDDMSNYSSSFDFTDRIFDVVVRRGLDGSERLELIVNFDQQIINLYKEVRSLNWLGFKRLIAIRIKADDAKTYYPYAISLQEALRTYNSTCLKIGGTIENLVAQSKMEI